MVELLIDLDLDLSDMGAYLSESDISPFTIMPDPIEILRRDVVEPITSYNLVPIAINCMWIVQKHTLVGTDTRQKINLCVLILKSFPELNDSRYLHHSIVEKLYAASKNRRLEKLRRLGKPQCCMIL
jgi:hypothetical protein